MVKKKSFKACLRCKSLVPKDVEVCPVCGSTEFTENWEGAIIIIKENSKLVGKLEHVKGPGRYAIRVGELE